MQIRNNSTDVNLLNYIAQELHKKKYIFFHIQGKICSYISIQCFS